MPPVAEQSGTPDPGRLSSPRTFHRLSMPPRGVTGPACLPGCDHHPRPQADRDDAATVAAAARVVYGHNQANNRRSPSVVILRRSAVAKIIIGRQHLFGELGIERGHRTTQGRRGRHHPVRAARRPRDRSDHQRAPRGADLPGCDGRWLDRHGAARIVRRAARPDLLAAGLSVPSAAARGLPPDHAGSVARQLAWARWPRRN
jgi:hypothetical protein